jgi:hypothetical protein
LECANSRGPAFLVLPACQALTVCLFTAPADHAPGTTGPTGVERNARALEKVLLDAGCTDDEVAAAWVGNAARIFSLG